MNTAILDQNPNQLSLDKQNEYLATILHAILDSVALSDEAADCLEVFGDYEWQPTRDADPDEFRELLEAGKNGEMTVVELDEFMDMVSVEGTVHLYFFVRKAKNVVAERSQGQQRE